MAEDIQLEAEKAACFGFWSGTTICKRCAAFKKCKAIVVSNGFDIVGETLEALIENLDPDGVYYDTDRVSDIVDQILLPPRVMTDEEQEQLALLEENLESDQKASFAGIRVAGAPMRNTPTPSHAATIATPSVSDEEVGAALSDLLLRKPTSIPAQDAEVDLE